MSLYAVDSVDSIKGTVEAAIASNSVPLKLLLQTHYLTIEKWNSRPADRDWALEKFKALKKIYEQNYGRMVGFHYNSRLRIGVAVSSGKTTLGKSAKEISRLRQVSPEDDCRLELATIDETKSIEVDEILAEAFRLASTTVGVHDYDSRFRFKRDLYCVLTNALDLLDNMDGSGGSSNEGRSKALSQEEERRLQSYSKDLVRTKAEVDVALDRQLRLDYLKGMLYASAALLPLLVAAGVVSHFFVLHSSLPTLLAAGAMGALGACMSVVVRFGREVSKFKAQADGDLVARFGSLRPLVGAVLGVVSFAILSADITPVQIPVLMPTRLYFFGTFGFFAGFGERWAQGLRESSDPMASLKP